MTTPITSQISSSPQPASAAAALAHFSRSEPDVQGIPAILVWAVGCMGLLMCLVGVGIGLYCYWSDLHLAVKISSLLLVPLVLWSGYIVAARHGLRSAEVTAVFVCLSWLDVLVLVQGCLYALPLWQMGLIFIAGLLVLPLLHPWRAAMAALAAGTALEVGLLWWSAVCGHPGTSYELLWVAILTALMLWAVGGAWCQLSRRRGYAAFGSVAPGCYGLFLCAFYTIIIFPSGVLRQTDALSWTMWASLSALWLLPVLAALPLHLRYAQRQHCSFFRYSALCFCFLSLISVPALLLVRTPLLTAPIAFAYALSIIWYGADYRSHWMVLAGCVAFFLSCLSIPLRLGINPLGGAVILILFGAVGLYLAFFLAARRRRLLTCMKLARNRQLSATSDPLPVEQPVSDSALEEAAEQGNETEEQPVSIPTENEQEPAPPSASPEVEISSDEKR